MLRLPGAEADARPELVPRFVERAAWNRRAATERSWGDRAGRTPTCSPAGRPGHRLPDLPAAPFPFEKPAETTREERNRLIAECHRLWRTESMDWAAVEAAMASDPLDIVDATLTRGEGRVLLT